MSPSFFKIMLGDFLTRLRVPPAFVKNFGATLPDRVHLTSSYVGGSSASWRVKMEKTEDGCYITEGWRTIAMDLDLGVGDFLVFELLRKEALGVLAYDRTCCEKRISYLEDRKEAVFPDPASAPASTKKCLPFFMKSLAKSDMRFFTLPAAAAREAEQWDKKRALIIGPKGRKWPVTMKQRTKSNRRVDFTTGWRDFIRDNSLSPGDTVRFKFLGGRDNVFEARLLGRYAKQKVRPGARH